MKCLLCSYKSDVQKKLIEHYLTYHSIDSKNWFFRKLFQSNGGLHLKNCIKCKEFLPTKKEKIQQDFLKHYNHGRKIPFEGRPLDIIRYSALTFYQIEYKNIVICILFTTLKSVLTNFYQMLSKGFM